MCLIDSTIYVGKFFINHFFSAKLYIANETESLSDQSCEIGTFFDA